MIAITSPSKSMDFSKTDFEISTEPEFLDNAGQIAKVLSAQSKEKLQETLGISEDLAKENFERYQEWSIEDHKKGKPVILAYDGDVFREIDREFDAKQAQYAQSSIRIISGLYGLLRPFDKILPYRLEMHTKLSVSDASDLYDYWGDSLKEALSRDLQQDDGILINLASNQYAEALKLEELDAQVVKIDFKEIRNGEEKTIAIYAKKARGMMMDYMIKNQVTDIEQLKAFDRAGYSLAKQSGDSLKFTRESK